MNKIWEQPMFSLISLEYIQVNGCAVRTRLFGRNAKGHVPLVTSLTANTKLTAKFLMRSIVNGCMYANRHRFATLSSSGRQTLERLSDLEFKLWPPRTPLGWGVSFIKTYLAGQGQNNLFTKTATAENGRLNWKSNLENK